MNHETPVPHPHKENAPLKPDPINLIAYLLQELAILFLIRVRSWLV
jgi:hypothetical protein